MLLQDDLASFAKILQCSVTFGDDVVIGVADRLPMQVFGRLKIGAGQLLHGSSGTFKQEFK